ncbi:hypothetical protein ACVWW6_000891 [Bradyrhizobium sp. USDA 3311]
MHTRPTTYTIDRNIDDELVYLRWQIRQYAKLRGTYSVRLPPSLMSEMDKGTFIADDQLREAIVSDVEPGSSMDALRGNWAAQAQDLFEAFFARTTRHPPYFLKVHVTRYGAGGSYHPTGLPGHPGKFISIKDPKIANSRWTFNQVMVHETIELFMHAEVQARNILQDAKEAIVDKFCSCNELQAVYGKYPKQTGFAGALPDDWQSYISWQPGESPSWD